MIQIELISLVTALGMGVRSAMGKRECASTARVPLLTQQGCVSAGVFGEISFSYHFPSGQEPPVVLVLSQGGLVHATLPSALPELLLAPEKPLLSVNVHHREEVNMKRDAEQE